MSAVTKDIRIPGIAYVIAIIAAIALIHENEARLIASTGIDAFYWDLIVGGLFAVAKGLNVGTEQLNRALDVIDMILKRGQGATVPEVVDENDPRMKMRGPATIVTDAAQPAIYVDEIPARPNKVIRYFLG